MSEKKYPTLIDGIEVNQTYQNHVEGILKEIREAIGRYCIVNSPVDKNCVIEGLVQAICICAVYNNRSLPDLLKAIQLVYEFQKEHKKAREQKGN